MKASKTLKTIRMNNRIKSLLFEAYRRNEMTLDDHEKSKPLSERWLGLGTAAAYRPVLDAGLMRFFDGEIPYKRSMGWLCLTELGIEEMQKHEIEFKMSCRNSIYNHYSYGYMMANGMTSTKGDN
jgi:hypothetical protein